MASPIDGDRWAAGNAYEVYMGRWSRLMAREFLQWLGAEPRQHWLEVGCGTGALTATIGALCEPASIVACDQSEPFAAHAEANSKDPRISFAVATADALPTRAEGFDLVVSGLVLNFIPGKNAALVTMRERLRAGGTVAAYIWDYSGGIEFLHHFWQEAAASDASAAAADEARRFGVWQLLHLRSLFEAAGLADVQTAELSISTTFQNFDDYWQPFLGGTGPAPAYVAALPPEQRDSLAMRLRARLPCAKDGSIVLRAGALAVRGRRA